MLANQVFWRLMHFYTHLLQPSVQCLSIVNFNNDAKPPPKWILREFDVSQVWPRPGGLPHLETFTWQNFTPAERVTRSGRPGYLPWRVTPPIIKLKLKLKCASCFSLGPFAIKVPGSLQREPAWLMWSGRARAGGGVGGLGPPTFWKINK